MKANFGIFRACCIQALCCYTIAFIARFTLGEVHPLSVVTGRTGDFLVAFTTVLRIRFFRKNLELKLPDKLLYISGVCLLPITLFPVWGEVLRSSPFGPSFIVLAIIFLTFIGAQIMYHQVSFRLRLLISLVITGYVALCLIRPAIN